MTEQQTPETEPYAGPNLAILKGVVWGLGVLLLAGFALIAVMLARGPQQESYSAGEMRLSLAEGDVIASTGVDEDKLIAVIERDGLPHRIVIIDMRTNKSREIPVEIAAP
ncbi:MAG: hypothetical protein AAGA69_09230 [Pseudomonadota bacterium]